MRFSKIFRFNIGSRILAIKLNVWNQELHTHYGITNEVPGTKLFVPFWDFKEDVDLDQIDYSLHQVQQKHFLSDIYILQTYPKQSYRAFCFDVMSWQEYVALLASTQNIDIEYLRFSVMRGRAVIRITEKDGTKNKLVHVSDGFKPIRISKHHQAFFSSIYPDIPKPSWIPQTIKVRLSKYESFR